MPSKDILLVAAVDEFPPGSRKLVKYAGTRNIAVYNHRGNFYAIDNACYHHGGPLLNGDIETLGGHPCVRCPWHSYEIALDTGEGLYWGIKPKDGQMERCLQSKGPKQRTHQVEVKGGEVWVHVDIQGSWESDGYANMAIANREAPQSSSGSTGGAGIHSGMRSGQVMRGATGSNTIPFGQQNRGSGGDQQKVQVKVTKAFPVCASGNTKMFVWERVGNVAYTQRVEPGQYATVETPSFLAAPPQPETSILGVEGDETPPQNVKDAMLKETRTWTITSVRGDHGGWFTTTVKRQPQGRGGSMWLHDKGVQVPMPLKEIAGHFTVSAARERINGKQGYLLMVSAGVGITPMYASLYRFLTDPFVTVSGPPLHVMHLHVEREMEDVPYLGTLAGWHQAMSSNDRDSNPVSYHFKLAVTKPTAGVEVDGGSAKTTSEYKCSLSPQFQPGGSQEHNTAKIDAALGAFSSWRDSKKHTEDNLKSPNPCADNIPNVALGSRLTLETHFQNACEHFGDAIKESNGVKERDFMVMVCGPQGFMDSTVETLATKCGVIRNNILTEAFDF